jgi:hypothetical protein
MALRLSPLFVRTFLAFALVASLVAIGTAPARAGQGFWDDDESVFEKDIEALANAGITSGCNPPDYTFFCANDHVTRGQMAAFLARALDLEDRGSVDFVDDNNSIFEADIEKLAAAGITKGCNPPANNRFCPEAELTRGQMAAFLVRALNYRDSAGGNTYVDDDGHTFEADIEKLAYEGVTKGCNPPANNRFCPDDRVTRGQMAAFLTRALNLPKSVDAAFSPSVADLPLVARYHVLEPDEGNQVDVDRMQYWPRGFKKNMDIEPDHDDAQTIDSTGRYGGWDVLSPSTKWEYKNLPKKDNWFHFELNRDARVAVVWRDDLPLPAWLSGWETGGTVSIDGDLVPVYERDYPAGEVVLGSVDFTEDWREMYLVLLAEADGKASKKPTTPEGFSTPSANRPCPAWVHDLHTTVGPDGKEYASWHPQIDPTYWCYFGHEHGSDPSLIPGAPAVGYGYVAAQVPQDEPNAGFKEFTFRDMSDDYWVRFVIHAGTHSERRVCAQFHTLYIQVYDDAGTEKYSAAFKADYGAAFATGDSGGDVLLPSNCGYSMPALANSTEQNLQFREINVGADSNNYERWDSRAETTTTFNLGMPEFDHSFDIRDPMSHCTSVVCNSVVVRDVLDDNATRRTLGMASWQSDFIFDADHALGSGEYFTDPLATKTVSPGAANAVRQYAEPGFFLAFAKNKTANRIECAATDPWTMEYTCYQIGGNGNLEHVPNPPDMMIERALWRN